MIRADYSEIASLAGLMQGISMRLDTDRHKSVMTNAVHSLLNERFEMMVHMAAKAAPNLLHHVYEWEHVGEPGFQLFRTRLTGPQHQRQVEFYFLPSKTTVPTETDVEGKPRWPAWFPTDKLRRIHVFVNKAIVFEYGLETRVVPQLSPQRLLVMPLPDEKITYDTRGRDRQGREGVLFTPNFVTVDHSRSPSKMAFTRFFQGWWGGGPAQRIIDTEFEPDRDKTFRQAYERRTSDARVFGRAVKSARFEVGTRLAEAQGKKIADRIMNEIDMNYIEMARQRLYRMGGSDA